MRWLKDIWQWIFPPRASTQTWMFLTFALFVGVAVIAVGLYVQFVLRDEVEEATQQMLAEQARRVAVQIQEPDTRAEQLRTVRELSRLTDLRITVASQDSILWDVQGDQLLRQNVLLDRSEFEAMEDEQVHFTELEGPNGREMFYVAYAPPNSDLVVRVGQPEPPLYTLAERTQVVLIGGMMAALLLALLGSWIASYQVMTPLKTIQRSARRVTRGDFEGKIEIDSRAAEFQDLATSLNRASDAFREKIEELERMAQLQNEFIGNVGHEVRNPIFAISGYLEALGSSSLPDEQRKRYAEKALINLQRLNNLFDDLIEIARLEYREDLIRSSIFDLQELVDEVADMLRPKAEDKGLNLEVENPHLFVEADRARIRQVLTNLIDNAISYTDEGTVRCRFRRRLDKVRIEVVDTGRGIDEEHLERIFERFYRIDTDRSRKSGGTGLGLSIVKQILQAHGEPIHVESTRGRGTRFWFELPYAEQPEAVAAR